MRFRYALVATAAALALSASFAQADNYPVRDGTGASRNFGSKTVGGVEYPLHQDAGPLYLSSGVSPVFGTISSVTTSSSLTPLAGRRFNVSFTGTGVFAIQLERQLGGSWYPMTNGASLRYGWSSSGAASVTASEVVVEDQVSVPYRWNVISCTACSISYRLEQ